MGGGGTIGEEEGHRGGGGTIGEEGGHNRAEEGAISLLMCVMSKYCYQVTS